MVVWFEFSWLLTQRFVGAFRKNAPFHILSKEYKKVAIDDYIDIISNDQINIGYIPGSSKVLFIKTGQGGTIYGYENKYLDLAIEVNDKYGWSVFVSATSSDSREAYERDMQLLEQCLSTTEYEVCYLGVSKGGLTGIWHGADNPKVKRIISLNAPLMINFHSKTLPGIKKLGKEKLTMVYGSLDPSYKYVPFVEKYVNVQIIEGANHNLNGTQIRLIDAWSITNDK